MENAQPVVQGPSMGVHLIFGLILLMFVLAGTLLILRFVFKLKWLTAICWAVLAAIILFVTGVRGLPIGFVVLLAAAVCVVILLVQLFRWLVSGDGDKGVNAAERDRILRMVEQGKITTEESTELLDALGRANALRGQGKFSPPDITMLIGVALVVLGFFLPWAYVRIQAPALFGSGSTSAYQAGYNLGAIGWAVFIIGILSAVPVFITPRDYLYKVSMLQVFLTLIGIVLVVSLLIQANLSSPGLLICLAGFIIELIGSAAKFKKLAA